MADEASRSLTERALIEARKFAVMFLYLWVVLSLFALHKYVIVKDSQLPLNLGLAFLNALLLAKVMATAEALRLADRFKGRQFAYPILYRSAIFAILLIGFSIVEEAAKGMWRGETFAASIEGVGGGRLGGILIVATIMFVVLIPFFAFKEIAGYIGEEKLYELFFGRRAK